MPLSKALDIKGLNIMRPILNCILTFSLLCFVSATSASNSRVTNITKPIFYTGSTSALLESNGVKFKFLITNKNDVITNKAGNLTAYLSISSNTPYSVSGTRLVFISDNAAMSSYLIQNHIGGNQNINFGISACDINRARVNIYFDFPDNYQDEKYYYNISLSSMILQMSSSDNKLKEFMNSREQICKKLGYNYKTKVFK